MSEHKARQFRPSLYDGEAPRRAQSHRAPPGNGVNAGTPEQQGWDAYRKWLSQVGGRPAQRTPLDHSIYSWKGYHHWADRIRQTWKSEET